MIDILEPSSKTEYVVGDEVYLDSVNDQRCYSYEVWLSLEDYKTAVGIE